MYKLFRKEIDNQGRIILPKQWRKHLKSKKVIIVQKDDVLKIVPTSPKLSSFFDKAKVSTLKTDPFSDYDKSIAETTMQ